MPWSTLLPQRNRTTTRSKPEGLRTVSHPVDPQNTPLGEPSPELRSYGQRSGVDLVTDAAKRALTPSEAGKLLETFRQLCVSNLEDARALEETADKLRRAGYKQELSRALREVLTLPGAHPQVGAIWMRRLVASNSWDHRYPQGMDALCERGEIGQRAVIEFLEIIAAKRRGGRLVRKAIRRHGKWLRGHPRGWGVAARALVGVRHYRAASAWMADWHERGELEPPLLHCLALALRGAGRFKEAHEVIASALAKPGADQSYPALKVWYALEEALAGNTQAAATHFKELKPIGWDDDLLCRYYLTRGVIRVQQAEPKSRKEALAAATARIKDHFRRIRIYQREALLRSEYRRCFWRMGCDAGRPLAAVVAAWRSADSCWMLLPLLLVPGLQFFVPLYVFRLCRWRKGRAR